MFSGLIMTYLFEKLGIKEFFPHFTSSKYHYKSQKLNDFKYIFKIKTYVVLLIKLKILKNNQFFVYTFAMS